MYVEHSILELLYLCVTS